MSYKRKLKVGVVALISLCVLGFAIIFPEKVNICNEYNSNCLTYNYLFSAGKPLFWGSMPFILTFFMLIFASQEIYNAWKKFAPAGIVITFLVFVFTEPLCTGFVCFDRTMAVLWSGILFFLVSLGIIIWNKLFSKN